MFLLTEFCLEDTVHVEQFSPPHPPTRTLYLTHNTLSQSETQGTDEAHRSDTYVSNEGCRQIPWQDQSALARTS